jgi:hypothetical protein
MCRFSERVIPGGVVMIARQVKLENTHSVYGFRFFLHIISGSSGFSYSISYRDNLTYPNSLRTYEGGTYSSEDLAMSTAIEFVLNGSIFQDCKVRNGKLLIINELKNIRKTLFINQLNLNF